MDMDISQLVFEKANILDPLANNYLDLTFIIDSGGKLSARLMTKMMILTSKLSTIHSFPAAYHLALLTAYTFRSS